MRLLEADESELLMNNENLSDAAMSNRAAAQDPILPSPHSAARAIVRGERLLTMRDVENKVGLKKTEIYERIKAGTFPAQLALGPNSVRWLESEIDLWIAELVACRLPPRAIKK